MSYSQFIILNKIKCTYVSHTVDIFHQNLIISVDILSCVVTQLFILIHLSFGLNQRIYSFLLLLSVDQRATVLFTVFISKLVL